MTLSRESDLQGVPNRTLVLLAGDVELNPGPVWVQYSLFFKGEGERVGDALLRLEEQWQEVPREALVTWLKKVLMTELANTLLRVDAVQVALEMPFGTPASNETLHSCLSQGFVNLAVVSPRPGGTPLSPMHPPYTTTACPQEVLLETSSFGRPWASPTSLTNTPSFTNLTHAIDSTAYSTSSGQPLGMRGGNGGGNEGGKGGLMNSGSPYGMGEKRKRQEKWTEHETLVLIGSKQREEEEHMNALESERLKTAADRWNRTAEIMRSRGVMDREGKNCEDKVTNLKKDWGKVRDWNITRGDVTRYWELSITDRKLNRLPVNMTEAVFTALDAMENNKIRPLLTHPDSLRNPEPSIDHVKIHV